MLYAQVEEWIKIIKDVILIVSLLKKLMSNENLVDGQFGHGAIPSGEALKTLRTVNISSSAPADFTKGFDIRNKLGGDIRVKNQMQSYSCVGQGTSYYKWVLHVLMEMEKNKMNLTQLRQAAPAIATRVAELSAKAIYSQITIGYGLGARFIDAANLTKDYGELFDIDCPSTKPDGTTDETFMIDKSWESTTLTNFAQMMATKEFAQLNIANDMNAFAAAIMENNGLMGGVTGSNGHGWGYAESPTPPNPGDTLWGHCLYYGAFGTDALGPFIATPNSWGQYVSTPQGPWQPGFPPGYGWQKIRANYFVNDWTFEPFVLVDKINS